MHQKKKPHPVRILLHIALVISLLFCTWLMPGAVAYGWLTHAGHYGNEFVVYGQWVFILSVFMTAAVGLYFFRKRLAAAVVAVLSYLPSLWILLRAMNRAEQAGWSGQTEASFGLRAAEVWRNGMMWQFLTLFLLVVLCIRSEK